MPTVYDRSTGQALPDTTPTTDLSAGLASGKYALDANAPAVPLKGADNKVFIAHPEQVAQALSTGAYSLMDKHEELAHQVNKEEAAKGLTGSLVEGARSFGNQALFGVPGIVADSQQTPEQKERRDLVEQYHNVARTAGGIAGFGASMLAGGELFKGAEVAGKAVSSGILPAEEAAQAGLAHKIMSKAADLATQGAVISSPQVLAQAAVGDPKEAAESLLWGIGTGAFLGGHEELLAAAGKSVLGLADKIASSDVIQEGIKNVRNTATFNTLGAERSITNKLSKDRLSELANFAHDEGFIEGGLSRQEIGDKIRAAKAEEGETIGKHINMADDIVQNGASDGSFMTAHGFKPGELGLELQRQHMTEELSMPMLRESKSALMDIINSADKIKTVKVNGQDIVPFENVQKFQQTLGRKWATAINKDMNEGGVKGVQTITPLDAMKSSTYQTVRDALSRKMDQLAAEAKAVNDERGPALFGALQEAKSRYSKLAQLEQMANVVDRQQTGNKLISLSDNVRMGNGMASNVLGATGSALGAAVGGVPGAMVGGFLGKVPGSILDYMGKRWGENRGMVYLSSVANKAAKAGPEVFSTVMAADAAKRIQASMLKVNDTIRSMALRAALPESLKLEKTGLSHLLDHNVQGKSESQQYKILGARLTQLANNPQALSHLTSTMASPFSTISQPLTDAYCQKVADAVGYLYAQMPKPPAKTTADLFSPDKWQPHPGQLQAWRDKIEVVANPMSALNHMHAGTLSNDHINALQTIFPSIYQGMKDQIVQYAAKHPDVKMPVQQQELVMKFMGQPTKLGQYITPLQSKYQSVPKPEEKTQQTNTGKMKLSGSSIASSTSKLQGGGVDSNKSE